MNDSSPTAPLSGEDRPVSVCHLFPALPLHGAENHFLTLARQLDPLKVKNSICLISAEGELVKDFKAIGIPVTLIQKKSRYDISIIWRLRAYLKTGNFDVIHSNLFTANLWGRLAAFGLQSAYVVTVHSIHSRHNPKQARVEAFFDRLLSHSTDLLICVTKEVKASMNRDVMLSLSKLTTIENGIDFPEQKDIPSKNEARKSLELPEEARILVVIGRFSTPKNHIIFISSLVHVREQFSNLKVLLVGNGEKESEVREAVSTHHLENTVLFLGLRRDIPTILAASDIMVIPSIWEGLPIVMLEAMAAGTPVIASRVGGIPDALTDHVTGLLTTPDAPSLSKTMIEGLSDLPKMLEMAKAAREITKKRYDIKRTAARYTDVYRTLTREHQFSRGMKDRVRTLIGKIFSERSSQGTENLRVLMYHRIDDTLDRDILCVTPFAFSLQMTWLREEGFNVLDLQTALKELRSGTLPPKSVAITFDDGYEDNYKNAFPILSEHGFTAAIFAVTGFSRGECGHPRYKNYGRPITYLTPDQIGEMSRFGISFGSHTDTHPLLTDLSQDEAKQELMTSKKDLESWSRKPVTLLAYPNGAFRRDYFSIIEKTGFHAAFTTIPGVNTKETSPWQFRRTEISGRDSLLSFSLKMKGGIDSLHKLYQTLRRSG
jgi:glycosyltransferase involved in cell wall biosynthesis/peptidoglycan/xylan/chitin deacetylase (PgdA/CDA1 family)